MTLLVSFIRGIGSDPSLLPRLRIGSIAWVMSGPTVTLHPHQCKRNQRLVHLRERTSITGKPVPDNPRGEGVKFSASLKTHLRLFSEICVHASPRRGGPCGRPGAHEGRPYEATIPSASW